MRSLTDKCDKLKFVLTQLPKKKKKKKKKWQNLKDWNSRLSLHKSLINMKGVGVSCNTPEKIYFLHLGDGLVFQEDKFES